MSVHFLSTSASDRNLVPLCQLSASHCNYMVPEEGIEPTLAVRRTGF
jgi:hypothetical protein